MIDIFYQHFDRVSVRSPSRFLYDLCISTHAVSERNVTVSSASIVLVKICQIWNNCTRIYPSGTTTLSMASYFVSVIVYYGLNSGKGV